MTKFPTISLSLTKLYVTSSLQKLHGDIRQNFTKSVTSQYQPGASNLSWQRRKTECKLRRNGGHFHSNITRVKYSFRRHTVTLSISIYKYNECRYRSYRLFLGMTSAMSYLPVYSDGFMEYTYLGSCLIV